MPGVESAAITDLVPLSGGVSHTPYARPDTAPPPLAQRPIAVTHGVSAGYLRTLGIPLLIGRDIEPTDDSDHPQVVLISRSSAHAIFPGLNPIGRQLLLGGINGIGTLTEVVGVVGDVRSERVAKKNEVEFYRPFAQRANSFLTVTLRGSGRPEMLLGTARAALDRVDRELPFIQPQTMEQVIRDSLGQQRLTMACSAPSRFSLFFSLLLGFTARSPTRSSNGLERLACAWRSARRRATFCGSSFRKGCNRS